jgi:hypothetical protein
MMMSSRETVVDYMTPLGLAHLMGTGDHYGPAPWISNLATASWNPAYFHRADATGIGFDRTATGSNAVAQYFPLVRDRFADPRPFLDHFLLFFHHVGWNDKLPLSGRSVWKSWSTATAPASTACRRCATNGRRCEAASTRNATRTSATSPDPAPRGALVARRLPAVLRERAASRRSRPATPPPPTICRSTRTSSVSAPATPASRAALPSTRARRRPRS